MRSMPPTGWNIGIAWSHSCSKANRSPIWEASRSESVVRRLELPGLLSGAGRLRVAAVGRAGVAVAAVRLPKVRR